MRRIIARSGRAAVEEIPDLSPPRNGYLVAGNWSLISPGTELANIARSAETGESRPLGYSLVGRVIASGPDAPPLEAGQYVTCAGFQWAWHAETAAVPFRMATPVPAGVNPKEATFTTLGALALHSLRQGGVTIGDRVLVVGLGLVGQLLCQVALAAGADLLAIDPIENRRRLARSLGAPSAIGGDDPHDVVERWSSGTGADVVFLCTAGGAGIVEQACRLARDRGRIVVIGTPALDVPRDLFFAKELTLTIARAYGPGRYDPLYEEQGIDYPLAYVRWTQERNRAEFLRLLDRGLVRVGPLISHEFDIAEAAEAYDLLRRDPEEAMGVLFRYEGNATDGEDVTTG